MTLATHDMARAVRFYRMLGFEIVHGGEDAAFTSLRAGKSFLNLVMQPAGRTWTWWGRVIAASPSTAVRPCTRYSHNTGTFFDALSLRVRACTPQYASGTRGQQRGDQSEVSGDKNHGSNDSQIVAAVRCDREVSERQAAVTARPASRALRRRRESLSGRPGTMHQGAERSVGLR